MNDTFVTFTGYLHGIHAMPTLLAFLPRFLDLGKSLEEEGEADKNRRKSQLIIGNKVFGNVASCFCRDNIPLCRLFESEIVLLILMIESTFGNMRV